MENYLWFYATTLLFIIAGNFHSLVEGLECALCSYTNIDGLPVGDLQCHEGVPGDIQFEECSEDNSQLLPWWPEGSVGFNVTGQQEYNFACAKMKYDGTVCLPSGGSSCDLLEIYGTQRFCVMYEESIDKICGVRTLWEWSQRGDIWSEFITIWGSSVWMGNETVIDGCLCGEDDCNWSG